MCDVIAQAIREARLVGQQHRDFRELPDTNPHAWPGVSWIEFVGEIELDPNWAQQLTGRTVEHVEVKDARGGRTTAVYYLSRAMITDVSWNYIYSMPYRATIRGKSIDRYECMPTDVREP